MDQNLLPQIIAALNTLQMQPHKLRGQNFLVSEQIVNDISDLGSRSSETPIVEIGAGLGSLSMVLAQKTKRLALIEIEQPFAQRLKDLFSSRKDVAVLHADALQFDYPSLFCGEAFDLFGNIPYNITTPLIKRLLICGGAWQKMILMVQAEAGQRLVEGRGRENGPLTLMVEYLAKAQMEFFVAKEAFYPVPAVSSVVISLERKEGVQADCSFEKLFTLIEAAFSLRRKTMANSLSASILGGNNAYWHDVLEQCGLDIKSRAEQLSLDDFRNVYQIYSLKEKEQS